MNIDLFLRNVFLTTKSKLNDKITKFKSQRGCSSEIGTNTASRCQKFESVEVYGFLQ